MHQPNSQSEDRLHHTNSQSEDRLHQPNSQSEDRLHQPYSQSEAGKCYAQLIRELSLVETQERGLSRKLKVSTVDFHIKGAGLRISNS